MLKNISHRVFRLSNFGFFLQIIFVELLAFLVIALGTLTFLEYGRLEYQELLAFFVVALSTLTFVVLFFCYKKSKVRNYCMDLPCIGAPRVEPGPRSGPFRRQRG